MRGNPFHNKIAQEAQTIFICQNWQVFTEYGYKVDGSTTYFDLFATKGCHKLACQIETTSRHVIENALKAQVVSIPVWFIVPNRKVRKQIVNKLNRNRIRLNKERLNLLLLSNLGKELFDYWPG